MEHLIEYGYIGLFLAAFIAATFIPMSSEVVFVGLLIAGANPIFATIAATAGNTLGGMLGYILGFLGKWEWVEKYFKVKEATLEKWSGTIKKYGAVMAFFSWLPGIGDFIPVILGFMKTSKWLVLGYMILGKATRYTIWAFLTVHGVKLFNGIF